MYILLAPGKMKQGVSQEDALVASDRFHKEFVSQQPGVIKRILLRGTDGSYADLVFFENKEAADKLMEAEQAGHPACNAFMDLWEMDESKPDMGVLSFEDIKSYE